MFRAVAGVVRGGPPEVHSGGPASDAPTVFGIKKWESLPCCDKFSPFYAKVIQYS